jgi:hypothetical protein
MRVCFLNDEVEKGTAFRNQKFNEFWDFGVSIPIPIFLVGKVSQP